MTSLCSRALSRARGSDCQTPPTREGWLNALRRSEPWIAAQQSIAHEVKFVA
ncbi:hypothetical protein [Pseudomonas sp. AIG]